jgi:hypothetical protein
MGGEGGGRTIWQYLQLSHSKPQAAISRWQKTIPGRIRTNENLKVFVVWQILDRKQKKEATQKVEKQAPFQMTQNFVSKRVRMIDHFTSLCIAWDSFQDLKSCVWITIIAWELFFKVYEADAFRTTFLHSLPQKIMSKLFRYQQRLYW